MKAFWKSRPVKTVGILAALLVLGMLIAAATGHGETILRVTLCGLAVDELRRGAGAEAAARGALEEMRRRTAHLDGGTAGIIVVDAAGGLAQARTALVMPWAQVRGGVPASGV